MSTTPAVTDYRLAPLIMARLVGAYLVLFAIVLVVITALIVGFEWNADLLVLFLGLGLLGLIALAWWLRSRLVVVRLTATGYRVNLIRGAGVREARWSEVEDAVAATPRGITCVVLRLRSGTTTTIPVQALAADKDDFAGEVQARLKAAGR